MRFKWIVVSLSIIFAGLAYADEYRSAINEGVDLYKDGEYDKAAEKFKDASILKPDKALPSYDKGTALYKSNDFEGAANEFQGSVSRNDPGLKSDAFYNAGNAYFRAGKYDQAVKSYVDALKLQPKDNDSKHNLEMALMQMKQQQKQQQQQNKDKQNQQQKQDQKKQDQQKQDQKKDKQEQQQSQNQQDKDKQDQKKQQEQQQGSQQQKETDKQKAQELLARFANDEKDIQKRLKQVHVRGKSANDW